MEELCHQFERDQEGTVLAEYPPQVIANTLKLYFRQLPEVRASADRLLTWIVTSGVFYCMVLAMVVAEVDIKLCMSVRLTASITNLYIHSLFN